MSTLAEQSVTPFDVVARLARMTPDDPQLEMVISAFLLIAAEAQWTPAAVDRVLQRHGFKLQAA